MKLISDLSKAKKKSRKHVCVDHITMIIATQLTSELLGVL